MFFGFPYQEDGEVSDTDRQRCGVNLLAVCLHQPNGNGGPFQMGFDGIGIWPCSLHQIV
ncbi:hypothetical protein [Sphingomonas sp. Ant20]|uniref:hypothetical protein n=1 Tax=Sphingomonas sp. Ant20 TaxID=104605 RepID=UPI000B056C55|nr:hypothetical protein [Sphingomonas sp. Ant20]